MAKESGMMMLLHAIMFGIVFYLLMVDIFNVNHVIAENRSLLVAGLVLVYMILFGHGLPTKINPNLNLRF